MRNFRCVTLIIGAIAWCATHAIVVRAEPPVDTQLLRQAELSIGEALFSLDGDLIKPKRICKISSCEENVVLKQGALLALLKDKSVAGLELFGAPCESSLESAVYYRVYIEDGVFRDIGKLTQLEYLDLYGVDLTRGVGLQCLAKLENLRVLRLTDCQVEFKQILAHLPNCAKLEIVKVWNDKFQGPDNGDPFERPVIRAMEIAKLTGGSPKLREIFLQSSEQYEPEAIAQFARLAELDYLHLREVDGLPADSVKVSPQQQAEGKKLEKLLTDRGFESWRHSGQRWRKSFTLPHTSIHVPEGACLFAAAHADSPGEWVTSDNGDLSLRLRVKAAQLAAPDSMFVIAEIRNNRTGPVTILRPFGDPYFAEAVQIKVWGEQGQIKYTGRKADYDLNAKAFVTLGANETASDSLELSVRDFAGTDKAGAYSLRYDYAYWGDWDKKVASEGVKGIWHGAMCSREIQVTKK